MSDDIPLTYPRPVRTKFSVNENGPFVIGVAGGASSGKQKACSMIMDRLVADIHDLQDKVVIIRLTDFYKTLTPEQRILADEGEFNFDHPDAVDFDLLVSNLQDLVHGKPVSLPKYDFNKHMRVTDENSIYKPHVIIVEGIFMLYHRELRDLLSLRVFVDVDSDVRLAAQVVRDTSKRYQKTLDQVLRSYVKYVKPSFEDYIYPSKKYADVVIPRGAENTIAMDLLAEHIVDILSDKGLEIRRSSPTMSASRLRSGSSTEILSDEPMSRFNEVLN